MRNIISILLQYIVPQHGLSRIIYHISRCRCRWFKNCLINGFIYLFDVDMQRAKQKEPTAYPHFNAFFTREFRHDIKPLEEKDIVSPVDAQISQMGRIENTTLLQAKGKHYQLAGLLASDTALSSQFVDGHFATLYLSPRDYHRIHLPCKGTLQSMTYVPGSLFSVSHNTVCTLDNLFARNERLICLFDTDAGPMAIIMVGAIFVSNMETVWHGEVNASGRTLGKWQYQNNPITLGQGQEMGRFNMGSTVILLFAKDRMEWGPTWAVGHSVRMGQVIGQRVI